MIFKKNLTNKELVPYGIVFQSKQQALKAYRTLINTSYGKLGSKLQPSIKICVNDKLPREEEIFFYDSHMYALYVLNNEVAHVN